jgi:putative glutamine amidotransferase
LLIARGSIIERVYGDGEIRVSSRHHMAIDELAPGFRITAKCADGVIEAIESNQSDWVAIGTQFHPECPAASAQSTCESSKNSSTRFANRLRVQLRVVA